MWPFFLPFFFVFSGHQLIFIYVLCVFSLNIFFLFFFCVFPLIKQTVGKMINAAAFVHVQAAPNPRSAQPLSSSQPACPAAPLPLHAHPFGNLIYFFFASRSQPKKGDETQPKSSQKYMRKMIFQLRELRC